MTREEILAMTDDELRIKAAELRGWTDICNIRLIVGGKDLTMRPNWQGRTPDGLLDPVPIPDWPNDIAAAWELVEQARAASWWWSASYKCGCADMPLEEPAHEVVLRDVSGGLRSVVYAGAVSLPRAITLAYVLAMDPDLQS